MGPDYDDASFWDRKFATGQDVGEWLNPGDLLIDAAVEDLERKSSRTQRHPRVLHLGPGISKLGEKLSDAFHQRNWEANGVVNVDFSAEAVRLGLEAENQKTDFKQKMPWVQADLRSWRDVSSLAPFAPFDVILDKSTSDAISTSDNQEFSPGDMSNICPTVLEPTLLEDGISLSPVELLALHLAPLTRSGTTWFALSYSTTRFNNFDLLAKYWTLRSHTALEAPTGRASSFAHTPPVYHWLYVLERREDRAELYLRRTSRTRCQVNPAAIGVEL